MAVLIRESLAVKIAGRIKRQLDCQKRGRVSWSAQAPLALSSPCICTELWNRKSPEGWKHGRMSKVPNGKDQEMRVIHMVVVRGAQVVDRCHF